MNLREYSFDRFRWGLLSAEQRGSSAVKDTVLLAVDTWKKDYRFLAAIWIYMFQRWDAMARIENCNLCNTYGSLLEIICNIIARKHLPWDDYQAFGRLVQDDPFNARWQDALEDGL